jgi:hypothetical protein
MADDDALKRIEARLMRLEAALAQAPGGSVGAAIPSAAITDSLPWWGGRVRPVVDPGVFAASYRWPTAVIDPAPWPWGPAVDPATYAGAFQSRVPLFHRAT